MYYFHFFFLDFHVKLPKRPDPGNTSTKSTAEFSANMLVVLVAASPSKPTGIRFPPDSRQQVQTRRSQVSTHITLFAIYHHQHHTLLLPYHIFWLPCHTFFLVYHRKFTLHSRKSTI